MLIFDSSYNIMLEIYIKGGNDMKFVVAGAMSSRFVMKLKNKLRI